MPLKVIAFSGLIFLCSCSKNEGVCENASKATLADYTGLDGCGWIIELDNGDRLEPTNLNDFDLELKDQQKIWVTYRSAANLGSICMVGEMVLIECVVER